MIQTLELNPLFSQPIGFERIAKVAMMLYLGCELSLASSTWKGTMNTGVLILGGKAYFTVEDPDENSSQSPPHIDHHCCYECVDSLDDANSFTYDSNLNFVNDSSNPPPQPPTYSYEFCGNDAHYGHDCPSQVSFIYNPEPMNDSMIELHVTFQAWLQQQQQPVVNLNSYTLEPLQCQKIPIYYDDDDGEESSTLVRDIIIFELPSCIAITPVLSTKEPNDSFIMRDEHLDTIPEKESNEFIKFSVENLVPSPSESEDISDGECDLPLFDDFPRSRLFTFSNSLFDINNDFTLSNDELFSEEDVPIENFKIFCNLLFDLNEEIISTKVNQIQNEVLEKFNSKNSDAVIESFSPSPIPVEGSDSLMVEIDIFLASDDSMPPGIENDDYDSERDILFLEELLSNDSPLLSKNKSFHFDVPSSPRPPAKPPDDDGIYFDDEPVTGILIAKVMEDISKHYVLMPRLLLTLCFHFHPKIRTKFISYLIGDLKLSSFFLKAR
uniref:Reverse transcriptase domain-containing protein n=1 Tax=Tanacetum cinerariifolium TaxID=118510 RepID=A0A6L2LSV6_TANCI|nr:hypothetical protein [Tanacetum cinerariifolium]